MFKNTAEAVSEGVGTCECLLLVHCYNSSDVCSPDFHNSLVKLNEARKITMENRKVS